MVEIKKKSELKSPVEKLESVQIKTNKDLEEMRQVTLRLLRQARDSTALNDRTLMNHRKIIVDEINRKEHLFENLDITMPLKSVFMTGGILDSFIASIELENMLLTDLLIDMIEYIEDVKVMTKEYVVSKKVEEADNDKKLRDWLCEMAEKFDKMSDTARLVFMKEVQKMAGDKEDLINEVWFEKRGEKLIREVEKGCEDEAASENTE